MSSTLKPSATLMRWIGVALFSPISGPTSVGRLGKVGLSGATTPAVKLPPGWAAVSAAAFALPPLPAFFGAEGSAAEAIALIATSEVENRNQRDALFMKFRLLM